MKRRVIALLSAALAAVPAFAQTPVDQLAKPPADAKIWTITSGDGLFLLRCRLLRHGFREARYTF